MEGGHNDHAGLHARNLAMLGLGTSVSYLGGMIYEAGNRKVKFGYPYKNGEIIIPSSSRSDKMVQPTPRKTPAKRKRSDSGASSSKTPKKAKKKVSMKAKRTRKSTGGRKAVKSSAGKKGSKSQVSQKVFARDGVILSKEKNGIESSEHCMYIGHGTDANLMFETGWYAVYKSIINKTGFSIRNWEDTTPFGEYSQLIVYYYVDDGNQTITTLPGIDMGGLTHIQVVGFLIAEIHTAIGTTVTYPVWNRVELRDANDTVANKTTIGVLDLTQYKITCDYRSTLKIQNRSLAANNNGGAADLADEEGDNVANQPLVGKLYRQREWLTGFVPNARKETFGGGPVSSPTYFIPLNVRDGGWVFSLSDSTEGGLGTETSNNPFRKPPPGYVMGKVATSKVVLHPGEIRMQKLAWTVTMNFNTYMRKLRQNSDTYNNSIQPIGTACVYALEKLLSMGSGDKALFVAYQIDQKVSAYGKSLKPKTAPLMNVQY